MEGGQSEHGRVLGECRVPVWSLRAEGERRRTFDLREPLATTLFSGGGGSGGRSERRGTIELTMQLLLSQQGVLGMEDQQVRYLLRRRHTQLEQARRFLSQALQPNENGEMTEDIARALVLSAVRQPGRRTCDLRCPVERVHGLLPRCARFGTNLWHKLGRGNHVVPGVPKSQRVVAPSSRKPLAPFA